MGLLALVGLLHCAKSETPECTVRADCDDGWTCIDGQCWNAAAGSCPAGTEACDGDCVDTRSDVRHCGGCGQRCDAGEHASAACEEATCTRTCDEGYDDCDGELANGCEVDLRIDPDHCGGCERSCPVGEFASRGCAMGECTITCEEGHGDCDGDPSTGCEVDLQGDAAHCGACDSPCAEGLVCSEAACVRPRYGSGRDGALVLDATIPEKVLPRVAVTVQGEAGSETVTVGDGSALEPGLLVLLHQSRQAPDAEPPVGSWALRVVLAVDGETVTLDEPLEAPFRTTEDGSAVAQLVEVPQYTRVVVSSGSTLRARPWDGSTGGILAFTATEGVEVAEGGTITVDAAGYRAGGGRNQRGEGQSGGPLAGGSGPNGVGGGVVSYSFGWGGVTYLGGGGGHDAPGSSKEVAIGSSRYVAPGGQAYPPVGGRLWFGGGGAGSGSTFADQSYPGGSGGGILWMATPMLQVGGTVTARGDAAANANAGSGAGGTIWIRTEGDLALGADQVDAMGGTGGAAGGFGRVVVEGADSVSGRSRPPAQWPGGSGGGG